VRTAVQRIGIVSSDTGIIELAGLSGANLIAVEHADPVVALCAAVTVIDDKD
jgi:hypothetical protein